MFLLLFSLVLFYSENLYIITSTQANPIPVGPPPSSWRIVGLSHVNTSTNISIVESDVCLDIDYTKYLKFTIDTLGEYTFYNHNETTTLTVLAPFDLFESTFNNFSLEVDNVIVPFEIFDLTDEDRNELIVLTSGPISPSISVLAANITFEGFSNTSVSYYVSTELKRKTPKSHAYINYLVSSGRIWFGNITEKIEFKVFGMQPDNYYTTETKPCSVADFKGGKSYIWEWSNEEMDTHSLHIEYESMDTRLVLRVIIPIIIVFPIIISFLIIIYSKRKQ